MPWTLGVFPTETAMVALILALAFPNTTCILHQCLSASCEIIKTESSRCGGIISIWFPHSEKSLSCLMRKSIIFNFPPGPVCEKMFDLQVHFKAGSYGKRRLWSHQEEDKTRPRFCSYCVHICSRQPCPHRWQVCRSQIMRRGMVWGYFVQVRRFCTFGVSDNGDGGRVQRYFADKKEKFFRCASISWFQAVSG